MGAAHRSKPTNEMIGLLVFIMTGNLSSLSGNIREFGRVGVYVSVKRVREKGGGRRFSLPPQNFGKRWRHPQRALFEASLFSNFDG